MGMMNQFFEAHTQFHQRGLHKGKWLLDILIFCKEKIPKEKVDRRRVETPGTYGKS